MTLEDSILADLLAGQSTADSIAGRLNAHPQKIAVILKRLERDELVFSGLIMDRLTVWRLTTEGHLKASACKPPNLGKRPAPTIPQTPA